jgi:hypothetical protein
MSGFGEKLYNDSGKIHYPFFPNRQNLDEFLYHYPYDMYRPFIWVYYKIINLFY